MQSFLLLLVFMFNKDICIKRKTLSMKIKWLALLLIVLFSYNGYSQKIDWNVSIPEYISATSAKLSLNKDFVKEGTASLQWQWFLLLY